MCTNTQGSFECSCNSGYALSADGTTCLGKRSNELSVCLLRDQMLPYKMRLHAINCANVVVMRT